MITITVDNQQLTVPRGTRLLDACLDNGIYVPHLCYLKQMTPVSTCCRLCFVSVQGLPQPVSACATVVTAGMTVCTTSDDARRLQRSALRLLLATHDVDCAHCPANKKCALQHLARMLNVPLKTDGLKQKLKKTVLDASHPCIDYYPNRCVLCLKCIHVCANVRGRAHMAVANRGLKTVVSFYGAADQLEKDCHSCLACVNVCPVGALVVKTDVADP